MENFFSFSVDGTRCRTEHQFLTGLDIKHLAHVPDEFELYLVVPEYRDELIEDDKVVNFARPGVERFEARKRREGQILIINTRRVPYEGHEISYEDVVKLAGYDPNTLNRGYTITYEKGPNQNSQGGLAKGQTVIVKHLMQFNVNATVKS